MKKAYRKPDIMFESYSLSANIAGNCYSNNLHTENTNCMQSATFANGESCVYYDNGYAVFTQSGGGCETCPQNDKYGNLCYHVSEGAAGIMFSS